MEEKMILISCKFGSFHCVVRGFFLLVKCFPDKSSLLIVFEEIRVPAHRIFIGILKLIKGMEFEKRNSNFALKLDVK